MSSTLKQWMDGVVAVLTALATYGTPLIAFITGLLGAIWYGMRIYDRLKGRKDVDVGHD